jgi:glycosyltransferase EpsH
MSSAIPAVSIIVPVYNVASYLRQCLDSLVSQTLNDIEIILVDDGSTDGSGAICDDYAARDRRFRVVHQPNQGVAAARNTALALVSGEFLMCVDGDDWIDPETCAMAVETLQRHQADILIFDYVREFNGRSEPKNIFPQDELVLDPAATRIRLCRRLFGIMGEELAAPEKADAISPVWGKLYRSGLVKQSGARFVDLAEIGSYEDGLFNAWVFGLAQKAVYVRRHWYHYRKTNAGSITTRYREALPRQWRRLFGLMREHLDSLQATPDFHQALDNRIALSLIGLGLNECANPNGHWARIQALKTILNTPEYRNALRQLPLRHFPIHWYVFFGLAKLGCASGVYSLCLIIQKRIARGS